jgi:hypothetical protein
MATTEDVFDGRLFPGTQNEKIADHLARSCARLQHLGARAGCEDVYRTHDHRLFTPPEGGKAGQGSTGDRKPPIEEEIWVMNMMFRTGHVPPPGQRWLVSANDRFVVVVAGWEVGPGKQDWLGGMQGEVHWYLGTNNDSQITIHGSLKDQTMLPGPIECARNERPVHGHGDPDRFGLPAGPFDAVLARARAAASSAPYMAEGCEPERRPCCRRVERLPDTLAAWRDFVPDALLRCRYGVRTRAGAALHSDVIMIVPEPVQLARWATASSQTIGIQSEAAMQRCSLIVLDQVNGASTRQFPVAGIVYEDQDEVGVYEAYPFRDGVTVKIDGVRHLTREQVTPEEIEAAISAPVRAVMRYARLQSTTRDQYTANERAAGRTPAPVGSAGTRDMAWLDVVRTSFQQAWGRNDNTLMVAWARDCIDRATGQLLARCK